MNKIIYFHGLESNIDSDKFKKCKTFYGQHDIELLGMNVDYRKLSHAEVYKRYQDFTISLGGDFLGYIGCSLGAYWANYLSTANPCPAVIINPSLHSFYPEEFPSETNKAGRVVCLGQKDELLDWKEAYDYFKPQEHTKIVLWKEGNHRASNMIDDILPATLSLFTGNQLEQYTAYSNKEVFD